MKPFRTQANIARDIMNASQQPKQEKPEVEIPLDNKEAEQIETPADAVMRKYCKKGVQLAQVKHKIIDNA